MTEVVVFGAGGRLGRRLVEEARSRGHEVRAAVRDPERHADMAGPGVTVVAANALDPAAVARAAEGAGVAISAVGPAPDSSRGYLADVGLALLDGLARAGVARLLVVGGAGSLELESGQRLVDQPDFPAAAKPTALAHADALEALRAASSEVDCLVVTPPAVFAPDGERTGRYRIGDDRLLVGAGGASSGSFADYASAVLDQVERPTRPRGRISVAPPSAR